MQKGRRMGVAAEEVSKGSGRGEMAFKFVSCMDITYSINCNDVDDDECSARITLIFG